MFSVAPNIVLAPNMTQNANTEHRTQTLLISGLCKITPFHYTPSLLSKFFYIHIPRQLSLHSCLHSKSLISNKLRLILFRNKWCRFKSSMSCIYLQRYSWYANLLPALLQWIEQCCFITVENCFLTWWGSLYCYIQQWVSNAKSSRYLI